MNSFSKSMLGLMFLTLVPLVGFSQVIEDDATLLNTPNGTFGDFQLGLSQTTSFNGGSGMGLFGVGIGMGGSDDLFLFSTFGIAEAYALFPVEQGDVISPSFVNSVNNNNTPLTASIDQSRPLGTLTLEVGESVFLGYWDDRTEIDGIPGEVLVADAGDNFGWLELGRSDRSDGTFGDLEILSGATAIQSGIIVGTTTTVAVPEPSSAVLVGLLGMTGLIRRRR